MFKKNTTNKSQLKYTTTYKNMHTGITDLDNIKALEHKMKALVSEIVANPSFSSKADLIVANPPFSSKADLIVANPPFSPKTAEEKYDYAMGLLK